MFQTIFLLQNTLHPKHDSFPGLRKKNIKVILPDFLSYWHTHILHEEKQIRHCVQRHASLNKNLLVYQFIGLSIK